MLNSSLCLNNMDLYTVTLTSKATLDCFWHICLGYVFVFAFNLHVSLPKLYILCLLAFDLFLTLTCSRCRLTTASESRLRRCR